MFCYVKCIFKEILLFLNQFLMDIKCRFNLELVTWTILFYFLTTLVTKLICTTEWNGIQNCYILTYNIMLQGKNLITYFDFDKRLVECCSVSVVRCVLEIVIMKKSWEYVVEMLRIVLRFQIVLEHWHRQSFWKDFRTPYSLFNLNVAEKSTCSRYQWIYNLWL